MTVSSISTGRTTMHIRGGVGDSKGIALSSAVDDVDDPSWITVFIDDDIECLTHWITIDYDHAIALHEFA